MSYERDLDFITDRLGAVNVQEEPKRKVRVRKAAVKNSAEMEVVKEPVRRMVRASRARPSTSAQVQERPPLPLQETPSIASDDKGKTLVRKIREALQAYRSVKGQLETYKNALTTAMDLMGRGECDKANKVLSEFKRVRDHLQKANDHMTYLLEHVDDYRKKTMDRIEAAAPKERLQFSKLLSYFLKYEPELLEMQKDVGEVYPQSHAVFAQLALQLEARKLEKQFETVMKGFKKMRMNE